MDANKREHCISTMQRKCREWMHEMPCDKMQVDLLMCPAIISSLFIQLAGTDILCMQDGHGTLCINHATPKFE